MITVNVINNSNFSKSLETVREAIIYKAGMQALFGNEFQVSILDADGYIIPSTTLKMWMRNMVG